jgi:hypothetical protein
MSLGQFSYTKGWNLRKSGVHHNLDYVINANLMTMVQCLSVAMPIQLVITEANRKINRYVYLRGFVNDDDAEIKTEEKDDENSGK